MKKQKNNKIRIRVKVDDNLYNQIKAAAKKANVSMTKYASDAIEDYLACLCSIEKYKEKVKNLKGL